MKKVLSLEDKVYNQLKNAIIKKKFPVNYKLKEEDIAEVLKVSRTPVRTALKLLEKDGLLAIIPNKGAFVTKKTYEEIEEAFKVRSELERMSVRHAIINIDDDDIQELENILRNEEESYRIKNRNEAYNYGSEFHMKIAKIAQNRFLERYIEDIIMRTDEYDLIYILNDPNQEKEYYTPKQHHEILQALKDGNSELAEKKMEEHILTTQSQLELIYQETEDPLKGLVEQ
jgi:DNA-binding GntR family transcriptional regulator